MVLRKQGWCVKINSIVMIFINLAFTLSFNIWNLTSSSSYSTLSELNDKIFPWVCVLCMVQVISFAIMKVSCFDFILWFSLMSHFFMFGYIFQDVFKLNTTLLWDPIDSYSILEMFQTYVIAIYVLQGISFGYLLVNKQHYKLDSDRIVQQNIDVKMYNVGLLMSILGGVSKFITDIRATMIIMMTGSYSSYSEAVGVGILDDLACLFIPGIIFLFFSGVISNKSKRVMLLLVMAYLVVTMLTTGSRKTQLFQILTLLIVYLQDNRKKGAIIKLVSIGFLGIILLNVIIVLRDARYELSTFTDRFIEYISTNGLFGNILGEVIAETRITALSVASIVKVVPDVVPYQGGMTFIRTIPSVFPIGWLIGDFFSKASATAMINSKVGIPVGSSFVGELYWNFGERGMWISGVLAGVILAKLFTWVQKRGGGFGKAMYFSIFAQLMILVRASFFDVYRPIMYIIIFVVICYGWNKGKCNLNETRIVK